MHQTRVHSCVALPAYFDRECLFADPKTSSRQLMSGEDAWAVHRQRQVQRGISLLRQAAKVSYSPNGCEAVLKAFGKEDLPQIVELLCSAQEHFSILAYPDGHPVVDVLLTHAISCAHSTATELTYCSLCFQEMYDGVASPTCVSCKSVERVWENDYRRHQGHQPLTANTTNSHKGAPDSGDHEHDDSHRMSDLRRFAALQCLRAVMTQPPSTNLNVNLGAVSLRKWATLAKNLRQELITPVTKWTPNQHQYPPKTLKQRFFVSKCEAKVLAKDGSIAATHTNPSGNATQPTWGFLHGRSDAVITWLAEDLLVAAPYDPEAFIAADSKHHWKECTATSIKPGRREWTHKELLELLKDGAKVSLPQERSTNGDDRGNKQSDPSSPVNLHDSWPNHVILRDQSFNNYQDKVETQQIVDNIRKKSTWRKKGTGRKATASGFNVQIVEDLLNNYTRGTLVKEDLAKTDYFIESTRKRDNGKIEVTLKRRDNIRTWVLTAQSMSASAGSKSDLTEFHTYRGNKVVTLRLQLIDIKTT
eukprot:INCI12279.1.p1 GENE.INCI12279.1~~INCI12279.1.p1  ORF type:complete len:532 (-),score=56.50 INCI12279.1:15-1610(-)